VGWAWTGLIRLRRWKIVILLWRRQWTFGLVKNCVFTLIILSVKSYICQNTWNRTLSYRFNATTRNICLWVEKHLSESRETFVWESRNICLRVEKHLSESQETFVWESRKICLRVKKHLSDSRLFKWVRNKQTYIILIHVPCIFYYFYYNQKCTINITKVYITRVSHYIIHIPTCFDISMASTGSSTSAPC